MSVKLPSSLPLPRPRILFSAPPHPLGRRVLTQERGKKILRLVCSKDTHRRESESPTLPETWPCLGSCLHRVGLRQRDHQPGDEVMQLVDWWRRRAERHIPDDCSNRARRVGPYSSGLPPEPCRAPWGRFGKHPRFILPPTRACYRPESLCAPGPG